MKILIEGLRAMKDPKPLAALAAAFLLSELLDGCSTPPWGGTAKPERVSLVILDTDIGLSTDDLFALEMLFRYEEAELLRCLRERGFPSPPPRARRARPRFSTALARLFATSGGVFVYNKR